MLTYVLAEKQGSLRLILTVARSEKQDSHEVGLNLGFFLDTQKRIGDVIGHQLQRSAYESRHVSGNAEK